MQQFKQTCLVVGILLLILALSACTPKTSLNTETEPSTRATNEDIQETHESTLQSQTTEPATLTAFSSMTTTKITFKETTTKVIQSRPYPTEMTPEIEKTKEAILGILQISDSHAEGIAKRLYALNIGELIEIIDVQSDPTGYGVVVKDTTGATYALLLNEVGSLRQIFRIGEKEPIFAALN